MPSQKARSYLAITAQLVVALTGIYLIAAPGIWSYGDSAENIERFIGPVIASFAVISAWEVTRNLRWLNILLALVLMILALSPWPGPYPTRAVVSDIIVGIVVIGLTCVPYPRTTDFGGGWTRLWHSP